MKKSLMLIIFLIVVLLLALTAHYDIATAENDCGCWVTITNTAFDSPTPGTTNPQDMNLQVTISYGLCGIASYSPAWVQAVAYACDSNENPITGILQSDRLEVTGNGSIVIQDFEITWDHPVPQSTAYIKVLAYYECAAAPYSDSDEQVFVAFTATPTPDPSLFTASFTTLPSPPQNTDVITFNSTTACSGCGITQYEWYLDGTYLSDVGSDNCFSRQIPELGPHTMKLIVHNDAGRTANTEQSFTVHGIEILILDVKNPEFAEIADETDNLVPCTEGMRLTSSKYEIVTGLETEIKIRIIAYGKDWGEVTVKEMSRFSISEFITGKDGLVCKTDIKVGEVDVKVDPRLENVDFSVSTLDVARGAVRGTHFIVHCQENPPQVTYTVLEGVVEVQSTSTNETIDVTAGQRAVMSPDSPIDIYYLSESELQALLDGSQLANHPPAASFIYMPENPQSGDPIVITSTSSDMDGDTLTYSWSIDGTYIYELGSYADWEWTDAAEGSHTVGLVVEDGNGGTDEFSQTITIGGGKGSSWIWITIVIGLVFIVALVAIVIVLVLRNKRAT